jgi:hypothetical protein
VSSPLGRFSGPEIWFQDVILGRRGKPLQELSSLLRGALSAQCCAIGIQARHRRRPSSEEPCGFGGDYRGLVNGVGGSYFVLAWKFGTLEV